MQTADQQYREAVKDIIESGSFCNDRTGTGTLKKFYKTFSFSPKQGVPILTSKFIPHKAALGELLWIYQDQSNDVELLKSKYGVKVWNEWAGEDGTIGKAYGYQVRKHNQIDRLIDGLKNNPFSRRHRIQLWSEEDAPEMNLEPCAFLTLWDYEPIGNKLNMALIQRSGDMGLGVPFNQYQYHILHRMIAQCVGMELGEFTHTIINAHVYVNHINPLKEQLARSENVKSLGFSAKSVLHTGDLWINPDITDFYEFTMDDIKLQDYVSHPKITMEVSV